MPDTSPAPSAKSRLLDAALMLIRAKGYSTTRVDEICSAAGVTKGAFFHHFASKEGLGVAAAEHWSEVTGAMFAAAEFHQLDDALDRVIGYLRLRRDMLRGGTPDFTCLVGTMVQEIYETAPSIRDACARSITGHAATLEADIDAAIRDRSLTCDWSARSLALHSQAVIQGAFVLAKAQGGAAIAADSIDHLIRYVELLFGVRDGKDKPTKGDE